MDLKEGIALQGRNIKKTAKRPSSLSWMNSSVFQCHFLLFDALSLLSIFLFDFLHIIWQSFPAAVFSNLIPSLSKVFLFL